MLNKLTNLYHSKLFDTPFALKYLWNRGLFTKTIKHFKVGYCDNNIGYKFVSSRYSSSVIKHSGIFYKKQDKFNNRIVFPLMKDGETLYFTSRAIKNCSKPHLHQSGKIPIFFNHDALNEDTITIVESSICAMTLYQYNFHAIATLGMMGNLRNHLNSLEGKKIYIAYDQDPNESGQRGAIRVGKILSHADIASFIIKFPQENITDKKKIDVNSYFRTYTKNVCRNIGSKLNKGQPDKEDFEKLMKKATPYSKTENNKKRIRQYNDGMFPIQIIAEDYHLEIHPTSYGAQILCPFHMDRDPSCSLYFNTGSFFCFSAGCGKGGDAVRFYQLLEKEKGHYMSRTEAIEALKKKY